MHTKHTNTHTTHKMPRTTAPAAFSDSDAAARMFETLMSRLHRDVADAAVVIAQTMCTKSFRPVLTQRGMYPFRGEFLFFVPYSSLTHAQLSYLRDATTSDTARRTRLANGDAALVLENHTPAVAPRTLLIGLCDAALGNNDAPHPSTTRMRALSLLLQRIACALAVDAETRGAVHAHMRAVLAGRTAS